MARTSSYNPEVTDRICELLAEGKSLKSICKTDGFPAAATVFKWMRENPEFLAQYTRAKEECADAMAEEVLDIADDGTNDYIESMGKDGEPAGYRINGEAIQRSRLRVDTRKWLMAKFKPKKYGDKIVQEVSGPNQGPIQFQNVEELTDEQLAAIAAGRS